MSTALVLAAVVVGLPGLATAAHLTLLAVASLFYREARGQASGTRFLVLVPAHNEERVIARCLEAIDSDRRATDRVLVVADRCTDETATIARSFGALVLGRGDDEEPGRAAARQAGLEHARDLEWDAVVMLDADSVIEPGFFMACERVWPLARRRSRHAARAATAARSRPKRRLPRSRCRASRSRAAATGWASRSGSAEPEWRSGASVALAHRFRAPASEDLFFTLDLLLDGVRCRHVDAARLRSEGASSWGSVRRAEGALRGRPDGSRARPTSRGCLSRAVQRARRRVPRGCVVPRDSAVRAWRTVAAAGAGLAAAAGAWSVTAILAAGLSRACADDRDRPDPGSRREPYLVGAARRSVVRRVEGRRSNSRTSQPSSPRPRLRADGASMTTAASGSPRSHVKVTNPTDR